MGHVRSSKYKAHDVGVSHQIGKYCDTIEVDDNCRWLLTSETPGLEVRGTLLQEVGPQMEIAWKHLQRVCCRRLKPSMNRWSWRTRSSIAFFAECLRN